MTALTRLWSFADNSHEFADQRSFFHEVLRSPVRVGQSHDFRVDAELLVDSREDVLQIDRAILRALAAGVRRTDKLSMFETATGQEE